MPAGAVFLAPQKGNGGGAVKRKNAFSPGSQALRALQPSGTQVVTVLLTQGNPPYVTTGGVLIKPPHPPTPCCTAHSSCKDRIDQLLFPRSPLRSALPGHSRPVTGESHPPKNCAGWGFSGKGNGFPRRSAPRNDRKPLSLRGGCRPTRQSASPVPRRAKGSLV